MIITIGRISVALGVLVSLLTISIGFGSKKAIKERMADFSGHINIKSKQSNSSYDSSLLDTSKLNLKAIQSLDGVSNTQHYATVTGILRTEENFAGVIVKGIGKDFDHNRFEKFLVAGRTPQVTEQGYNNGVVLSEKIARNLHLKVKDSIVSVFSRQDRTPLYRKFEVVGLYKTDIRMIDDQYILADINHVRKILNIGKNDSGGVDVFVKDVDKIDQTVPLIEPYIGIKNYLETAPAKYPQIMDMIKIFDNNIAIIIVIMLAVVIINIIMVLLFLIIERTNSIGLLKTMGAHNGQIRAIFISYTLLIIIPGLVVGNIIALVLLGAQRLFGIIKLNPDEYYVSTVPVDMDPLIFVLVSAGIMLVSALSLVVPSYIISKISPVKSVNYS